MACYEEKTNGWEVNQTSRVDLFAHPFRKLRIDPTATNKEIDEAVDLAREQQLASNEELAQIRESLFNPLGRLSLELSYPLDGTAVDIHALYATLSSDASTGELLSFAERLPPLSRANFQAHIATERPAECAVLRALVDSHACIELDVRIRDSQGLAKGRRQPRTLVGERRRGPAATSYSTFRSSDQLAHEG